MKIIKGAKIKVTGELIRDIFQLPDDSKIFKILPSKEGDYCYEIFFLSEQGYEIAEGSEFPLVTVRNKRIEDY